MTTFGTLNKDGSLSDVRVMDQSRFADCPFTIFVPEHYRPERGCLCSNAKHRKMMIKQWEYTRKDFKNIPLID